MKPTPKKRGRGQPAKEATKQIRAYAKDVPRLMRHGKTQAEAVRRTLHEAYRANAELDAFKFNYANRLGKTPDDAASIALEIGLAGCSADFFRTMRSNPFPGSVATQAEAVRSLLKIK